MPEGLLLCSIINNSGRAARAEPPLSVRPQSENKFCPLRCARGIVNARRGIPKGEALVREQPASAPLWPHSLVTFLAGQESNTLPHLQEFFTPKVFHNPCGMWKEFLWKSKCQNLLQQGLWKSSSFQQCVCGEKCVAALAKKGLFHIILYYGCYD